MAFGIPQTQVQTGAERKTQKTAVKYFKLCKPTEQKGLRKLTVTNFVDIDVTVDKIKKIADNRRFLKNIQRSCRVRKEESAL